MQPAEIEHLEQAVTAMVVQALTDFRSQAATIFREETDLPQDIAEDVTREAMDVMGVSRIAERLYGKVDYKRAIYAFLPDVQPVALMLDAKAEKANGDRTATIQMSQTSMVVRMRRSGMDMEVPGILDQTIVRGDRRMHVVTVIAKYVYEQLATSNHLRRIIVACIPSGILQNRYNPSAEDTIWLAGRDAPTLGENFRVRLSYSRLRAKAAWRVREIDIE